MKNRVGQVRNERGLMENLEQFFAAAFSSTTASTGGEPMKKFSTAGKWLTFPFKLCLSICIPLHAFAAARCEWAPSAPEQHRVQRGDTLWDLASIFLKNPWCWPRVWDPNQSLIRDPHWIYPGQVITLDRARDVLRLSNDHEEALRFTRLSPGVRAEPADSKGIPLISRQLQMLLSRSPVLSRL